MSPSGRKQTSSRERDPVVAHVCFRPIADIRRRLFLSSHSQRDRAGRSKAWSAKTPAFVPASWPSRSSALGRSRIAPLLLGVRVESGTVQAFAAQDDKSLGARHVANEGLRRSSLAGLGTKTRGKHEVHWT